MNNKASITALMSSFGRAFHAENEDHPVFADHLAKNLMTVEEYAAVQGYILGGAQFFEPEIDPAKQEPKELLRRPVCEVLFLMARRDLLPFGRSNRHDALCAVHALRRRQHPCVRLSG